MTTTINISLPKKMHEDVKKMMLSKRYTSASELIRDALRKLMYEEVTVNGFTPEFENMVLEAEKEPMSKDKVWKTEKDIENYFKNLRKKLRK